MATARRAFPRADLPHLVETILFEERPTASSVHPLVPEALSSLIGRMLDRDPCQRHPCANAAADEIDALAKIFGCDWCDDAGVLSDHRPDSQRTMESSIRELSFAISELAV
jgi:serine/threonine protein kinase